jgi:hypothetical protein
MSDYGDFDPNIPRDWEVWCCDDDGYALVPPDNAQAKKVSGVKLLLGAFRASYHQAKERMTELACAHIASLSPEFTPTDTGYPAWVRCEECDDFVCTRHPGLHAADCECPPIDIWALYDLDPYSTGGQPTQDAE